MLGGLQKFMMSMSFKIKWENAVLARCPTWKNFGSKFEVSYAFNGSELQPMHVSGTLPHSYIFVSDMNLYIQSQHWVTCSGSQP